MFKAILCAANVHAPVIKQSGNRDHSAYQYTCSRCDWASPFWNEDRKSVRLPLPTRLAQDWAPVLVRD